MFKLFYLTLLMVFYKSGFCQIPLVQETSTALFSNCTSYRETLGDEYYQMVNSNPPNTSLVYIYHHTSYDLPIIYPLPNSASRILESSRFNKSLPIAIFIHGFMEDSSWPSVQMTTARLLRRGGLNVFHLDSHNLIGFWYMYASMAVKFIGESLGIELAIFVADGVLPENIHLIGFSLGAQISGFAGKKFTELTGNIIGRISGLDPAGPCFYDNPPTWRLNATDASFVDVIHTNSDVWGLSVPVGHVDFYPNGGYDQPFVLIAVYSHFRAYELYAESILDTTTFIAAECPSWHRFIVGGCILNPKAYMGYATPPTTRGIYFTRTKLFSPYGFGPKSVPASYWQYLFP